MAVQTPPPFEQNASYTANAFRLILGSIFGAAQPGTLTTPAANQVGASGSAVGGVVNSGDLVVTAHPTANMSVTVAGGSALIPQTLGANGGLYLPFATSITNTAIAAASPSFPRVDLVCGSINDKAFAGSTTNWVIQVISGTPTSGATKTNLLGAASVPASSIPLGYVQVTANVTSITATKIRDARPFAALGNPLRGVPEAFAWQTTPQPVANGVGGVVKLGASTLRNGFTSGTYELIVPVTGTYLVLGSVALNGATDAVTAYVIHNGTQVSNFGNENTVTHALVRCVAGDTLQLGTVNNSGGSVTVAAGQYATYLHAVLVSQ